MELTGRRVTLRPLRPGDEAALARVADNPAIARNLASGFPHPYTEADAAAWVAGCGGARGPLPVLAITSDGAFRGVIGADTPKDDNAEGTAMLGYWLSETVWGLGIATEAVGLFLPYVFRHFPLVRLEARVYGWNPASGRVLEKNGFTLEGRLRQRVWHWGERTDLLIYGLLRSECPWS